MALTLPCTQCAPNAPAVVVGDEIRCLNCESVRPLIRAPLYLVTGAPGSGKSTIVPLIAGRISETAVLETDLFGPLSHPDWEAWATSWLLLVHALAQSCLRAVLVGYGLSRSKAMSLDAKDLLGPVRVLNLDLRPDVLRERLSRRGTLDPAEIERKVEAATVLRGEADENVDVTIADPQAIADRVVMWLASVT